MIVSAPTQGHISSPFGWRQLGDERNLHTGLDFVAWKGAPIRAVLPGKVIIARQISGYGNAVVVAHADSELFSLYGHLDEFKTRTGKQVRAGDRIGTMGGTGWRPDDPARTVPVHLHFEFLSHWPPRGKDLDRLNPMEVFSQLGLPFDAEPKTFAAYGGARGLDLLALAAQHLIRPYPWRA